MGQFNESLNRSKTFFFFFFSFSFWDRRGRSALGPSLLSIDIFFEGKNKNKVTINLCVLFMLLLVTYFPTKTKDSKLYMLGY